MGSDEDWKVTVANSCSSDTEGKASFLRFLNTSPAIGGCSTVGHPSLYWYMVVVHHAWEVVGLMPRVHIISNGQDSESRIEHARLDAVSNPPTNRWVSTLFNSAS